MKNLLLSALFLAAACGTPPEVLPPPFGAERVREPRLFFPTGIAVTPSGALLVANGNFNHAFDAGTLVSLPAAFVSSFFQSTLNCDVADPPKDCDKPIPTNSSTVMIGNYAGPLQINDAATTAYTASRDTGILNAVAFDANGALSCPAGVGTSATDCRKGLVDLKTSAHVDGPYGIVPGTYQPAGASTTQRLLFVSSVVPHIDGVTSGITLTSSQVAALDMTRPEQILFTIPVGTAVIASGTAPGPMAFDAVNRRLYLSGCYQRFLGSGAGEPASGKCFSVGSNLLRIVEVDAQASALPRIYNLYDDVHSVDTTQLLLAEPDAATGAPHALWATMNTPDTLVRIELPQQPSSTPRVTRAVPLAITPADLIRIPRPGSADLLGVVSERSGTIAFYDTGLDAIVGQVDRLGDQPFSVAQLPCPATTSDGAAKVPSACLAVTVFNECRIAFVEVPLATPWTAALRGRGGGCP